MSRVNEINALLECLFPICRSITGDGVRETLSVIKERIPLETHEVPTGTLAFDWTVPKEWNIRDAYVIGPDGKKFAEFSKNNLHVMSYSIPVHETMPLSELQKHLHSLPEAPGIIPYKTSYYNEDWGICLSHNERQTLTEGMYEVSIDSTLEDGNLTYGELLLPGESKEEVLLHCYVCHPSMANDNLSGIVLLTFLAEELAKRKNRYSYRFVFVPETIGTLVWLSRNQETTSNIKHGLVATCVGDGGSFTYKRSRRKTAVIDRVAEEVLKSSGVSYTTEDFFPLGSDERQYCSPGFNLPIGSLMRTRYYNFPEYHTSADNLTLVKGEHLEETLTMYMKVLETLEKRETYVRTNPYGEPQLGRRGLYATTGGPPISDDAQRAISWVLNYADGEHTAGEIAVLSQIELPFVNEAIERLRTAELLTSA